MKLATTTADFRDYCDTPAEWVRAMEGTGFTHLDFSFYRSNTSDSVFMRDNDWMHNVIAAAKEAERLGFDFVQAHSPGNDWFRSEDKESVIKGNIRSIEACAYLGVKNIVVHSGRIESFRQPQDWNDYLQGIRRFYEALYPSMEKYGVYVLAENYIPADAGICSLYRAENLLELLSVCDHPMLGVCWDVGHANLTHPDQYGDIVRLGDKLKAVHIQDNFGTHDDHFCPLMGTLDIDAVMRGLRDNGFMTNGGVFTFECDNLLTLPGAWPNCRNESGERIAAKPTLALKRKAEALLFEIGKSILEQYGCFES